MIDFGQTSDEFRAEYYERKPGHFPGALADRPFKWSDIDQLLHTVAPTGSTIRVFHHGEIPQHAYTEESVEPGGAQRRINKAKFYDYMGSGATLQFNWLERHSVAAKRLCLEVGRFAGMQTTGNAYLSFTGDGTFGKHWDTHDVFAIQLIGRKRWRIFAPTFPLPLTRQTHDRSGQACPPEPALELVLEEGDVMYLPRGWWHHVIPLELGSFHLSVGLYPPSMFDYVIQTSAKYLEQQLGARRAFSAANYRETVAEVMQQLPAVLLDEANATAFERDWVGRERTNAEFNLASLDSAAAPLSGDVLLSLATSRPLMPEAGVVLINGAPLRLEPINQKIVDTLHNFTSLRLDALCECLKDVPDDSVHRAVLDLARHDIVTIQSVPHVRGSGTVST